MHPKGTRSLRLSPAGRLWLFFSHASESRKLAYLILNEISADFEILISGQILNNSHCIAIAEESVPHIYSLLIDL